MRSAPGSEGILAGWWRGRARVRAGCCGQSDFPTGRLLPSEHAQVTACARKQDLYGRVGGGDRRAFE